MTRRRGLGGDVDEGQARAAGGEDAAPDVLGRRSGARGPRCAPRSSGTTSIARSRRAMASAQAREQRAARPSSASRRDTRGRDGHRTARCARRPRTLLPRATVPVRASGGCMTLVEAALPWRCRALAVASPHSPAPAGAAPLTRPALPAACREWGGEDVVALACDPRKRAAADPPAPRRRGWPTTSRSAASRSSAGRGAAAGGRDADADAGATRRRRRRAERQGRWPPQRPRAGHPGPARAARRSVDVTAQAGRQPAGHDARRQRDGARAPAPLEARGSRARAHAAAAQLLSRGRSAWSARRSALTTLCAGARPRRVLRYFELLFGDPAALSVRERPGASTVFGDENVPRPTSTGPSRGASLALAPRPGAADAPR